MPMRSRRFAITATDRYLGVLDAFLEHGWTPVKLFTCATDDRIHQNKAVIARAEALKIDIQLSRMDDRALADLADRDCDLLVVASYRWRIGNWQAHLPKAINFHPSPLPYGRGPYPLVEGILSSQLLWGATCHKVGQDFDTGDILAQKLFKTAADETHESLDLKTQMATHHLARTVASELDPLWEHAKPQGAGQYVPYWTDAQRTLNFNDSIQTLDRQIRAFGRWEVLAQVNQAVLHVHRAQCWNELHSYAPGTLVHSDGQRFVVACADGFVALLEWHLMGAEMATGTPIR